MASFEREVVLRTICRAHAEQFRLAFEDLRALMCWDDATALIEHARLSRGAPSAGAIEDAKLGERKRVLVLLPPRVKPRRNLLVVPPTEEGPEAA